MCLLLFMCWVVTVLGTIPILKSQLEPESTDFLGCLELLDWIQNPNRPLIYQLQLE